MRAKMSLDDLKNMFDLSGKVAVVTGGSGGAGKAISIGLALYGADVVCTSRTLSTLEDTASQVEKLGRKALPISCDVTDKNSKDEAMYNVFMQRIPIGRPAEPEDLVGAILYLCTPASAMVTRHILYVDGGTSAW